jgi:hypothetical protein
MTLRKTLLAAATLAALTAGAATASAQEPHWWGQVLAFGPARAQIEATPIRQRPYRPFHIYGNTVHRQYYRGSILPTVRDFRDGTTALFSRR